MVGQYKVHGVVFGGHKNLIIRSKWLNKQLNKQNTLDKITCESVWLLRFGFQAYYERYSLLN